MTRRARARTAASRSGTTRWTPSRTRCAPPTTTRSSFQRCPAVSRGGCTSICRAGASISDCRSRRSSRAPASRWLLPERLPPDPEDGRRVTRVRERREAEALGECALERVVRDPPGEARAGAYPRTEHETTHVGRGRIVALVPHDEQDPAQLEGRGGLD